VLNEQQRRILKRPSSSPSQRKQAQAPTTIATITLDDDPDELPSTSKDSKQPKMAEIVPNASGNVAVAVAASEVDVVDHAAAETKIKEEVQQHQQQHQPLINSTCDKIEPSECSEEVIVAIKQVDNVDVVEPVAPAATMPAIAAVTPAAPKPEPMATNPEVVNQFVSYLQSVELTAGKLDMVLRNTYFVTKIFTLIETKAPLDNTNEADIMTGTNSHDFVFADTIDHG